MRSALDVANHFVEYSGFTKTPLQIQKLTYIAHGYMLGVHGVPLVRDQVEAWEHGPVFPEVFHEFKRWKFNPVGAVRCSPEPFGEDQQSVLDDVYAAYGRFCGYFLSDITHDNSDTTTPWRQHYKPGVRNVHIPDSATKAYYKRLYEERGYYY